jgi:flagellin-like hook-associated protein FlgL
LRADREAFVYNPLTHTYEYQGDLGEMGLPLNSNSLVGINIPGSEIFSPVLRNSAPSSLSDGTSVIYTESKDPVTGVNTITIEIGDPMSAEHDVFTVTNIMDIANRLSYAWQYEDIDSSFIGETKAMHRIEALQSLIDDARTQVLEKQTELATRRQFLKDAEERTKNLLNTLKKSLSLSEDADLTEVAIEIQKAQTGLEALRISSIKLLSTSLLDFLK